MDLNTTKYTENPMTPSSLVLVPRELLQSLADSLRPFAAYGRPGTRDVEQAALQRSIAGIDSAIAAAPVVPVVPLSDERIEVVTHQTLMVHPEWVALGGVVSVGGELNPFAIALVRAIEAALQPASGQTVQVDSSSRFGALDPGAEPAAPNTFLLDAALKQAALSTQDEVLVRHGVCPKCLGLLKRQSADGGMCFDRCKSCGCVFVTAASPVDQGAEAQRQDGTDWAWEQTPYPCDKAPDGWRCTRASGHADPCAAQPTQQGDARNAVSVVQAPAEPWRDAVGEALVCAGLDCLAPDDEPNVAIKRLVDWNVLMALDPLISERAAALIQQGRAGVQAPVEPARQEPARQELVKTLIAWAGACTPENFLTADLMRQAADMLAALPVAPRGDQDSSAPGRLSALLAGRPRQKLEAGDIGVRHFREDYEVPATPQTDRSRP